MAVEKRKPSHDASAASATAREGLRRVAEGDGIDRARKRSQTGYSARREGDLDVATPTADISLLVVDDDPDENLLLPFRLRRSRRLRRAVFATTLEEMVERVRAEPINFVLCDNRLAPHPDYREVVPHLRAAGYRGPLVVMSGCVRDACFAERAAHGVCEVVDKANLDSALFDALIERHGAA